MGEFLVLNSPSSKTVKPHQIKLIAAVLLLSILNPRTFCCFAATTITPTNHYAYGANVGWIEARGDVANGAVINEYVCSGYVYGANVGWISFGGGSPANGIRYQNSSGTDYGVNHDGFGNLRGYAYGANIGWVNFENTGAPKVDLATGKLSGYAYSANCGWISLSNAQAVVQTATIAPGSDSDGDGIADGWELTYTNTLTAFTATSDTDRDGLTDKQEAWADTNPFDPGDNLRITTFSHGTPTPTYTMLWWTSKPTRKYEVQRRSTLGPTGFWQNIFTLPSLGADNVGFDQTDGTNFYRIRAFRPLAP